MSAYDNQLSRRRFLQATAAVGAAVGLGGITAACSADRVAQGGTFNWMTWGDHYIDTQLKAIEASDKIIANITELKGNAEGFAKVKEVKGQLDMISGDALWVPDAYNKDGLIDPFDINSLKVASQLYPFARTFPIWTTPEGYLGYPFGWSPISIYYNPKFVDPAPDSWQVLLDPKYKGRVVVEKQPEEIVAYMARAAGFDKPYDLTDDQLSTVKGYLEKLKPNILKFAGQATDSVNVMISEEAYLITGNFGNEDRVKDGGGPEIKGYIPKEGTVGWMDAEMIVKGGANKSLLFPVPREGGSGREHRGQLHHPWTAAVQRDRPTRSSSTRGRRIAPIGIATTNPKRSSPRRRSRDRAPRRRSRSSSSTRSSGPRPKAMATETVGGAALVPPTPIRLGRGARLRRLAPFLPAGVILVGLFFVPLALMFVFSLWHTNANLDVVPDWSLQNYANFFSTPAYVRTLAKTMLMGAGVTVVCLLVAFAVAYFLARYISRRWARYALLIIIVPFWTSYLLRVYAWQAILGEHGVLNQVLMALGLISKPSFLFVYNDVATFIVLVYVYVPFAALVLYSSLDRFDFTQLTAAQDLGARPLAAFRHILLPQIRPGIITACIFVFIPILGEFLTPSLVGGAQGLLIANLITNFFENALVPEGAALSFLIAAVVLVLLIVFRRYLRVEDVYARG